jgi:hypothetical protein
LIQGIFIFSRGGPFFEGSQVKGIRKQNATGAEDEFAEDEFLKNSEDDFLKARFCSEDEFIGRLFLAY